MRATARGRAGARRLLVALSVVAAGAPASGAVTAQETGQDPLTVRVDGLAGTSVYVRAGRDRGLEPGTVLLVRRDEGEALVGRLVVESVTRERALLSFAGAPFPLTRGEVLHLGVVTDADVASEDPPEAGGRSETRGAGAPYREGRRTSVAREGMTVAGTVHLELSALESVTEWGAPDRRSDTRTFATPAVRLRTELTGLPGGARGEVHVRLAHRAADPTDVDPATSVRIYSASVEGSFLDGGSLGARLGRFRNPHDSFTGYWDGLLLRWGGRDLGVGAAVGFQPELWNEAPSSATPKAAVFVDARREVGGGRWRGELVASEARPDGLPTHRFLGLTQSLALPGVALSARFRGDRDPEGGWALTRAEVAARGRLGEAWSAGVRAGRRTPYRLWLPEPLGEARDFVGGDLFLSVAPVSARLGLTVAHDDFGGTSRTGFGHLALAPGAVAPARLSLGVLAFGGDGGDGFSVSPAVDAPLGAVTLRGRYRYYRLEGVPRDSRFHEGSLSGWLRLSRDLDLVAGLRVRRGASLRSVQGDLTLSRSF